MEGNSSHTLHANRHKYKPTSFIRAWIRSIKESFVLHPSRGLNLLMLLDLPGRACSSTLCLKRAGYPLVIYIPRSEWSDSSLVAKLFHLFICEP